jgi:hypothetical protein
VKDTRIIETFTFYQNNDRTILLPNFFQLTILNQFSIVIPVKFLFPP